MAKHHITFDLRAFRQALVDGILETFIFGEDQSNITFKNGKPDKPKRWLKGHEVRRLLNISADELQDLRENGTLPYRREFGTYRYDYRAILDMVESPRSTPTHRGELVHSPRKDGQGSKFNAEANSGTETDGGNAA